jgi:hypothetical protein
LGADGWGLGGCAHHVLVTSMCSSSH